MCWWVGNGVKLKENEDDTVVLSEESFKCHSVTSVFNVLKIMICVQLFFFFRKRIQSQCEYKSELSKSWYIMVV